jgi:hypothetical protein
MTPKENTRHAINLGLAPSQIGETNNKCKLSERDVLAIRAESEKRGLGAGVKLAKEYNVGYTAINKIIKGVTWKHLL